MKKSIFEKIREGRGNILLIGQHPQLLQSILDFDALCGKKEPSVVGIIAHGRKSVKCFFGNSEVLIPCYRHVDDMKQKKRESLEWMINVQSGRRVRASTDVFFERCPHALGGVIFAEGVPEKDATDLIAAYGDSVLLLGPASVGLMVGGALKLGAIGGVTLEQLHSIHGWDIGNVAVISTSGGMTNELMHTVIQSGNRISVALSIGGDRFPVTSLSQVLTELERDSKTKAIVYFGELGGLDEYEIVRLIESKKITKPCIAYIAGAIDAAFAERQQFGHAKALVQTADESALAKRAALIAVGAYAPEQFDGVKKALDALALKPTRTHEPALWIRPSRRQSLLTTRNLRSDVPQSVVRAGKIVGSDSYELAQSVLFALIGKRMSRETAALFDMSYRLLLDHGGHVSGAVNAMITARAGKDLVAALSAGLLTIGPRFGGAINDAARQWHTLSEGKETITEFIERHAKAGIPLAGIGHKKYRVGVPDPRVAVLATFAGLLKKTPCLDIARSVEEITTRKSGSLILNVDGILAALFLDMFAEKEKYSNEDLRILIAQEFFNALFIIPRTVGFIGHALEQKKNDEGLFRLPEDMLFTDE